MLTPEMVSREYLATEPRAPGGKICLIPFQAKHIEASVPGIFR